MKFELTSDYKPTGDQPTAIKELVEGVNNGDRFQTLLGVTGSGKTFTMANVIQEVQRPTLVLSHNKTLVAQLYGEFKQFFPNNSVEYFVSYYDYYQPEAYLPTSNTYIEKDLSINEEVEKLRLSASSALLSGRRDVIVVASVSCIYGIGNPIEYQNHTTRLSVGQTISRNGLLHQLVDALYSRTEAEFGNGTFRVKGDTVDINLPYADYAYRVTFWGDEIEEIESFDPTNGKKIAPMTDVAIFPANLYIAPKDQLRIVLDEIVDEKNRQVDYFKEIGKYLEAKRLEERITFDVEMIRELGYCSGIENYSRYLDRRNPGDRPFCLLDYFPDDFLMVIDESHVTLSQVGAMYGGDRARKTNLVEYGFRLPSALDNRPLNYQEFEDFMQRTVFVSATPGDKELEMCDGVVVEQVVRPTGLLDPIIDVRPSQNQIDDLLEEIDLRIKADERVLVTTLTKRMSEELQKFMQRINIRSRYIHSEVDTLERVEILRDLRLGKFDVLVGVNLLREGLDLPEVSLVAILDADKEGFLRSERSLTQIAGRAARNVNGLVIMYADKITNSMRRTMDETDRRREKQLKYNELHNITPTTITRTKEQIMKQTAVLDIRKVSGSYIEEEETISLVADPVIQYMNRQQMEKLIKTTDSKMKKAAKELDFLEAARLRDELYEIQAIFEDKFKEKA